MANWIFQCKTSAYEYDEAIIEDVLKEWNVKQHKKDIRKNDGVVIWFTGKNAGINAIAKVISDPEFKIGISSDNHLFNEKDKTGKRLKEEDKTGLRVTIDIIRDLRKTPISKDTLRNTKGLENFKAGTQGSYGTNLPLGDKEYNIILGLIR